MNNQSTIIDFPIRENPHRPWKIHFRFAWWLTIPAYQITTGRFAGSLQPTTGNSGRRQLRRLR